MVMRDSLPVGEEGVRAHRILHSILLHLKKKKKKSPEGGLIRPEIEIMEA